MEFRAACSAAGPKLRVYTQWVRWRAPTERNKKTRTEEKTYPDGCPRCQVCLGAVLVGVALSLKLRLDVHKRLVQRPCAASSHPPNGLADLAVPVSRGRGTEVAFSRRRRVGEQT